MQTLKSLVDQMVVVAPADSQVFRIPVEDGEFVLPGVPLISLVDLHDMWVQFDLREDLLRDLKVGSKIDVRVPALGDRVVPLEVRVIGSKGEYTGWRATRASGDFDLRTFEIRAYPIAAGGGLRPGMSVYTDWRARRSVMPARTGLFAVAAREVRWILRDPVARFLLFGVPVIAFALLGFTFSAAVVRGLDVVVVDMDNSATSRLFVQTLAAAPGISVATPRRRPRRGGIGDPRRARHRRGLPAAGVRQGRAGRPRAARGRPSSTPSSSRRGATRERASTTL